MNTNAGTIHPDSPEKLHVLVDLVERYAPLEKWGFKHSAQFPGTSQNPLAYLIFNSEICRVKFVLDYSANGRKLDLRVSYGRLHAPDNKGVMPWQGEECYCWHSLDLALRFLDRMSPQQAAAHDQEPRGVQEFLDLRLPLNEIRQPEWFIKLHATVWEYYGYQFFQLFDLQHPESWNHFTKFVSDYYDIRGRHIAFTPSLDKIC
jgi:hypothetical protein